MARISENDRVLSVDVGSSSVRAALHDATGEALEGSEVKLEYEFDHTHEGGATTDAEDLLGVVARAIDGALSKRRNAPIACVAAGTFWHSVLGVDGDGRPTTPILTWADRRSAGAAATLRDHLDEEEVHRRTGAPLHSSYWPAKLLWLADADPDAFRRTERWVSPADFFYSVLFGGAPTVGTSMASATGLYDQNGNSWYSPAFEALPVDESQLPALSDEPRWGLQGEWAGRWPELSDVPWFPAVGDGACSNIGCGCTRNDRLALMVGTSGAMRVLWKAHTVAVPSGPWCYRADRERFVMGGALSDGGNLVGWLRETLRLPDEVETESLLSGMEPDAHGLTFLPILNGERGPAWADRANGTISGLAMSNTPVDILRAAMEAVAHRFTLIADMLEEASPQEKQVVATGGGLLNSPTWTRIMADALGRPVTLSGVKEASARGATLLALERLGALEIEETDAPLGETYVPDPNRHEIYRKALARQRRLYEAVV